MPILFSCLANHRDFPSDSESDDPDFDGGSDEVMDGSEDSVTCEKDPPPLPPPHLPVQGNGKPSTACSPVLVRSPDTTTGTPSVERVETSSSADEANSLKKKKKKEVFKKVRIDELPTKKRKRAKKDGETKDKKRVRRKKSIMIAENVEGSNSLKLVLKKKPSIDEKHVELGPPPCAPGLWDRAIPKEILLKIFQHAVDKVGVLPFLVTMQDVCRNWKEVAQDVSLWEKVDMSVIKVTENQLSRWANSGMLKRVREINLSNFGPKLTQTTIVNLVKNCPRLEILNVSYNTKLSAETMDYIINNCEKLRGIDISGTTKNRGAGNCSMCAPNVLKSLMTKRGDNLIQLCLAENSVASLNTLLNLIPTHLPKLQVLDLSNITTTSDVVFPLERIQEACPDLRVLRLANTQTRLAATLPMDQARSPGFPKLEELSVAKVLDLGDSALERILKTSEKLTLLDVRSCKGLSVSGLVKIPAWDLTQLYLANCAAANNPDVELAMKKWAHSLKVIDVSWVSHETAINGALQALATHADTPSLIYDIDLKGSSVSFETLKLVLEKCQRLRKLNLTSCRSLPRGIKRVFEGSAVHELRLQVAAGRFEEEEG